jgi:hypothetical protein
VPEIASAPQTPEGGTPIVGPDPVYLRDPLLDATVRMVVELTAQVWVERERRIVLEARLTEAGVLPAGAADNWQPSAELAARIKQERDRLVDDVFKELRRIPATAVSQD